MLEFMWNVKAEIDTGLVFAYRWRQLPKENNLIGFFLFFLNCTITFS